MTMNKTQEFIQRHLSGELPEYREDEAIKDLHELLKATASEAWDAAEAHEEAIEAAIWDDKPITVPDKQQYLKKYEIKNAPEP